MKTTFPRWLLLLLPLALAGCPATPVDDDDSASDDDDDATADDDDATADDDDATSPDDDDDATGPDDDDVSTPGNYAGTVIDPFNQTQLADAAVTVLQDPTLATVTDAAGEYFITAPDLDELDIRVALGTRIPLTALALAGVNRDGTTGLLHPLIERTELEQFHTEAGQTYDAARAGVWVAAIDPFGQAIDGATIDLSVPYGVALIAQDGPPVPGNTLNADASQIIFFNVDVGADITVTLDGLGGLTCEGRNLVTPIADEVVFATFICE